MQVSRTVLPLIIVSQFCCTSLWFASNGVMPELIEQFGLNSSAISHLTSAVQFGFITGTLTFAILTISDRYSPSLVFLLSAISGALFNAGMTWEDNTFVSLLSFRFLTGFFLAGIYPVGMKIAADYYEKGLGKSLGFLVGALVLGTAFPHLLESFKLILNWKMVLYTTSTLAFCGGLLIFLFVPNGPFRKASRQLDISKFLKIFKNKQIKSAALGYFGHMWELYAFWTFVPLILYTYQALHPSVSLNIPLMSFLIIASGAPACVIGGYISQRLGEKKTAFIVLTLSCLCCILSPLMFLVESETIFLLFIFFWGTMVIPDSPLFSSLVAQNASGESKGTALTIVNCIGFAITIISIQLINIINLNYPARFVFSILAIGPIMALISLIKPDTVNPLIENK